MSSLLFAFFFFFFDYKREELQLTGQYYVLVDDFEEDEDSVIIQLNGISAKDFSTINRGPDSSYRNSEIESHFFKIVLSFKQFQDLKRNSGGMRNFRRNWIRIKIVDFSTLLEVIQWTENGRDPETISRYIESIDSFDNDKNLVSELEDFFYFKKRISRSKTLERLLNEKLNKLKDGHLNVYNVGQGNLTAICDQAETPYLYFDLGGGFGWNKHTYPDSATLVLCWCRAEIVFISHWDMDHIETLRRLIYIDPSQIQGKIFITSQKPRSSSYINMAKYLDKNAKLIYWPSRFVYSYSSIEIGQCTANGDDKNNSCLYIICKNTEPEFKSVLNPGDASYKYLPIKDVSFDGLVATHHGANFKDNNGPIPSTTIGYRAVSCGVKNSYNHPKTDADNAYSLSGWSNKVLDTRVDGNISFNPIHTSMPHVCIKPMCNLFNLSHF